MNVVAEIGQHSGSATWVSGVVGVHPFEIAQGTRELQQEIWGEDTSVWVASPYAPFGRARRVDGGYVFTGRWPWSTGNYHCEWAVLGGLIVGADGNPGDRLTSTRHFFIPKADYTTYPGEWPVSMTDRCTECRSTRCSAAPSRLVPWPSPGGSSTRSTTTHAFVSRDEATT